MIARQRTSWMFAAPAMAYLLVFFGYPLVKNVVMSFQHYTTATFYTSDAPYVGLSNYRTVVDSGLFSTLAVNTAAFTLISMSVTFVIGLTLALFFVRHFPLSALLRSVLLLPWLLPLIVSGAIWRRIMDQGSGILNQVLRDLGLTSHGFEWLTSTDLALASVIIVNVWIGIPFVMVILYSGLQDIPAEYYEAAALDGATGRLSFRHITWPLLRPVTLVVLVLGVIYTLRVLDIVLVLTGGGPANATQTFATQAYQLSFQQFEFGQGAALSNILIVVSLCFAAVHVVASRRSTVD